MSHRINILSNFVSKEDCDLGIKLINQYKNNNELIAFKDNPNVLIAPQTNAVTDLLKKYSILINKEHKKYNGFIPQLYTTEGFLSLWENKTSAGVHVDSHKGYEFLQFATIFYLNDDFEGGKLFFPNQNYIYKPKKGDAVIFPCGGTEYPHGVTEVKNGLRYTIAMWHTSHGKISKELN